MKKLRIPITSTLVVGLVLATTIVVLAMGGGKAARGLLGDEVTIEASKGHSIAAGGDGTNAGFVGSATGNIEGLGAVTVLASTSWDWGSYRGSEVPGPPELEVHRCALFNTTPHTFTNAQSFTGLFTATATVTITTKNGDVISGKIVGGSNCELYDSSNLYTGINESLVSFEITGGTGKFDSASGTGFLRSAFDFGGAGFVVDEIFLHLEK